MNLSKMTLAQRVVRAVRELADTPDPEHPHTVQVNVNDLEAIIDIQLEEWLLKVYDAPAPLEKLAVSVKALEWTGRESWEWAKTPFGDIYTLRPCTAEKFLGKWLLSLGVERIGDLHDNEEAAKAAAQSDFEQRILSALVATSTEDGQ